MPRNRQEEYQIDRVGTSNQKIDEYRGSDGMSEDNGKVTIGEEDVEEPLVVHEVPSDARGVVLTEIHAHNSSGAAGTFRIWSGTFDDPEAEEPVIDEVTERSVPYSVAEETTRTLPYIGRSFEEDFIAVTCGFEGEIGVGVYNDHREYEEPASEQTGVAE